MKINKIKKEPPQTLDYSDMKNIAGGKMTDYAGFNLLL